MSEELETVRDVAKAVEAWAKPTDNAIDLARETGSYIAEVLGDIPKDLVGLFGGDRLRHARIRNLDKLNRRTRQILKARDSEAGENEISPSVLIPIASAASNESRDELQELFARLLANAADADRQGRVRREFIDMVAQMEPLDARLFMLIAQSPALTEWLEEMRNRWPKLQSSGGSSDQRVLCDPDYLLNETGDAVTVSMGSLVRFELMRIGTKSTRYAGGLLKTYQRAYGENLGDDPKEFPFEAYSIELTPLGREFIRALEV